MENIENFALHSPQLKLASAIVLKHLLSSGPWVAGYFPLLRNLHPNSDPSGKKTEVLSRGSRETLA